MRFLSIFILLALLATPAYGARDKSDPGDEPAQAGGFEGPVTGAQADTVAAALKQAQDARIVLTGNITSSIAGEKNLYVFRDPTGEMLVIITPRQFKGNTITPNIRVRLSGKLEKHASDPEKARLRVRDLEIIKEL